MFIAMNSRVRATRNGWKVPSQSKGHDYNVTERNGEFRCTCRDYQAFGRKCKHVWAVQFVLEAKTKKSLSRQGEYIKLIEDNRALIEGTERPIYPRNWPAYNLAQTSEKWLFQMLLADLCRGVVEPEQRRGRPRVRQADRVFSMAYKVYSMFSARRFTTDLKSAQKDGYISKASHFNTVLRFFRDPSMTPLLTELVVQTSLPLKYIEDCFATDASGFASLRYLRWQEERATKRKKSKEWVKVHLMCGVKTNIITAVEVSPAYEHDSLYFRGLLRQTAKNFEIAEVLADKGYSTKPNLEAVKKIGGQPYIPFKSNAKRSEVSEIMPETQQIWDELLSYYNDHFEEFLRHYHKRSNVEVTYSMIKRKFGETLRAKKDQSQINEVLCKVLCHNVVVLIHSMFELGVVLEFWGGR